MHLPCKQVDVGTLPTGSTNFKCGENEIRVSFISSTSVGATPTPATNIYGKWSGGPTVNCLRRDTFCFGNRDPCGSTITGTSHHFALVAE